MLSGASARCTPAATKIFLQPSCLVFVGHVGEHARRGVAVVAGDNQPASCGHMLNHSPKRIRSQLLRGFTTKLLETVARLGKLVDTLVRPMMPKHDGGRRGDPVEAVIPRGIQAFGACARK